MSFFRYPGGKNKLKKIIIKKILPYINNKTQYREVFFGGGSICLDMIKDNTIDNIWINDKDIGIACLWTSLISHHQILKEKIIHFTPSVDKFYNIRDELLQLKTQPSDIIDIGFKKLAIHQLSFSGLGTKSGGPLGGKEQKSAYKIDCRWSPDYICKKIDKIHNLLNNIKIYKGSCTNLDFEHIINDNHCNSVLYLDPPYYIKGNELYQYGFTQEDHIRLSNLLYNTKHKWVLSYDDCEEIQELYQWANIQQISASYTISGSRQKTELLIWNN